MLDRAMRKMIDPPLNLLGAGLVARGVSANMVTFTGLAFAVLAAISISFGSYDFGLVFVLLSRLADGLDGAVARASQKTDFGGYLDVVCDFFFYGVIPFSFIIANSDENALAGGYLLLAFYVNGASFLGYSVLAEKKSMENRAHGSKSLYYSNGLLEGTETIVLFVLICLWPMLFPLLAWGFGTLCFITAGVRVYGAYRAF